MPAGGRAGMAAMSISTPAAAGGAGTVRMSQAPVSSSAAIEAMAMAG